MLWRNIRLRQLDGHKFRRQHPIGKYVVDFASVGRKLAIEIDGGQHYTRAEYDRQRTIYLEARGYKVLRFWNSDVFRDVESVMNVIFEALRPPPQSSP